LCLAVLNLTQFSTAVEAKDDGGYNVVYDGGSIPGLKAGAKLRVYIESNEIRITENKTLITTLVPSTIQDISYGQDVHRRIGAAIGLAVISFGIGGLMALTKSKVAEQAALEKVPLTDLEKRMMYFTETDPASCENPLIWMPSLKSSTIRGNTNSRFRGYSRILTSA
jgi:hypothetical protein